MQNYIFSSDPMETINCLHVLTGFPTFVSKFFPVKKLIYLTIISILLLPGCSLLQQTSEMTNFSKCDFRLESVDNVNLAGINIENASSITDLGVMDYAKISSVLASGSLPLTFNLNVQARNPNNGKAAMNKLDWILFIDDIEMTRGILNDRVEILPNNITSFPVGMNFDLMKALSGESGNALLNFAFNLSGSGERPTRVKLKAKPTIYVGGTPLEYPGYITIKQDFGAK
jgi:hypothetical protein